MQHKHHPTCLKLSEVALICGTSEAYNTFCLKETWNVEYDLFHDFLLQSALTGESLPVTRKTGDEVYSGSTCKHGEIEAVVIATGVHSFFGKAAHLVDTTEVIGHFQKVSFGGLRTYFSQSTSIYYMNKSLSGHGSKSACFEINQ